MRVAPNRLRALAAEGRVHLIFVPHFFGSDAWLMIEETPGRPRDYAREGDGALLTLEGEHSYFRSIERALALLEDYGFTTEPGSTRIRPIQHTSEATQ